MYDPTAGIMSMFVIWIVIAVVIFIINIAICVWVYRDAKDRDMNETMWLLIVLLTGCIGVIIYLIVRE